MSDRPPSPLRAVVHTIATSLLAIAAAAGVYLVYLGVRPAPPAAQASARDPEQSAGAELIDGRDYRVLVAVARIKPENPDGKKWDSGSKSTAAPDPFYEIWWRGNRVYRSQEVKHTLVASWSNVALPQLYELIAGEKLSLETIKEGALITAHAGDSVRIRIVDDDPFKNDLIEELTVPIEELRVGDQVRAGRTGLENVTLRVIPRDVQQLKYLIQ